MGFLFKNKLNQRKVLALFEVQLERAIIEYKNYQCVVDIKNYWMNMLKKVYEKNPKKIEDLSKTNLHQWALAQVSSQAFDMIASGRYHLMDILTSEGEILLKLYRSCLKNALEYKYIDKTTYEQQMENIVCQIHETGTWA